MKTSSIQRNVLALLAIALGSLLALAWAQSAQAQGTFPYEMSPGFQAVDRLGPSADAAGAHPDIEVRFGVLTGDVNGNVGSAPQGTRKAITELPVGLVGDPTVLDTCGLDDVLANEFLLTAGRCPRGSAVGWAIIDTNYAYGNPYALVKRRLWRVATSPNEAAAFATSVLGLPIRMAATVTPSGDYRVRITGDKLPQQTYLRDFTAHLWGVPADHQAPGNECDGFFNRDTEVYTCAAGGPPGDPGVPEGLTYGAPLGERKPFFTNGSVCDTPLDARFELQPYGAQSAVSDVIEIPALTGCEDQPFAPSVSVAPSSKRAGQPSGYAVELDVPQSESPEELGTAHVKDVTVTMPEGVTISPSSANGLGACTDDEFSVDGDDPADCANKARIGTVTIETPLLDETLGGHVFLGEQLSNDPASGQMYRLFIQVRGPGVLIKLEGAVKVDPETGQITTTFENNPQMPFEHLTLELDPGQRASLVNPRDPGTYLAEWEMTSYSGKSVGASSSFEVTGPQARGFDPRLRAGTANPVAGSYSPFSLTVIRPDGDQELKLIDSVKLPEGLVGKIASIPTCAEAQAANGTCAESSRVGHVELATGAGNAPLWLPEAGKDATGVYLTGPYKGAPYGLSIVVPAQAGPFDLGRVVVRSALQVDKRTAQITAEVVESNLVDPDGTITEVLPDALPRILKGIVVDLREVRLIMDRDQFMLNPTDCSPQQISAQVDSYGGSSVELVNAFTAVNCASLGFDPQLKLSFGEAKKNTKANAHPQLDAKLSFSEGDANISSVEVALPQGVLLDQERLGRICSRANYAAETCPEESVVGYAKATTPLLDDPVEGPVYLKASDNTLPDLAADLNGQIDVDLFGRIDQKTNKKGLNQIRNTFDVVPDVPVSDFELTLEGGDEGLLVNSRNICRSKSAQKVSVDIAAHNGMATSSKPLIGSACKQLNKKKAKKLKAKAKKLLKKAKKADDRKKAKQLRKQARKLKRQARKLGR